MLNSADGVMLPTSKYAPPIATIRSMPRVMPGSFTSAMATLVIGPSTHSVTEEGSAAISVSTRKSTPCCASSAFCG